MHVRANASKKPHPFGRAAQRQRNGNTRYYYPKLRDTYPKPPNYYPKFPDTYPKLPDYYPNRPDT
ncbi:MAG: hypothetical protein LBJ60_09315 [Tannerellaceae bacterium]|nr:hypothetical protein [Tannerellaceae bacterium]